MEINVRIGQLSNDQTVYLDKCIGIDKVLSQAKGKGDTAYQWMLNHTAKAILVRGRETDTKRK